MGNGPGKDEKADPGELWTRLTQLPRPKSEEYEFRARGEVAGRLVFWVLTASELATARVEANKATKAALGEDAKVGNLAYEEEYQEWLQIHILWAAARQLDDQRFPSFLSPKKLRELLTDDEITTVIRAYADFRRRCGPILSELTPDEMEAWIRLLQEGGSRFPLAACTTEALIDLISFLVSKLPTSPTGTSSAGSPPGEPASPTDAT